MSDQEKEQQQLTSQEPEKKPDEKSEVFDELDRAILKLLQGDIPLVSHPYKTLAEEFGISEDKVLRRIEMLRDVKVIRRIGATINHQQAGYTVTVMTAWNAEPREGETRKSALNRVGKTLAANPCVTYCYARKTAPGWDWPVFAMLHAKSEEEMNSAIKQLMQKVGTADVRIMKTVREWKKTSMQYF